MSFTAEKIIMAEKLVTEMAPQNMKTISTVFIVYPGETVEELLLRIGLNGESMCHYDNAEVRLKLVLSRTERGKP